MFTVYANRSGPPLELTARRDTFSAGRFSWDIAPDCRSGTLTLGPESRSLRVGSGPEDYERVRVFDASGELVGTLALSAAGVVTWSTPVRM